MDTTNNANATLFTRCVALVRDPPASLSRIRLTEDQKLKIYALYKQGVEGDNSTACPGLLDFVGRAKWNAWKALTGLSKAEAQARYVACVRACYGDAVTGSSSSSSSSSTSSATRTTGTAYHRGHGGGGNKSEDNFSFGSNQVRALGAIGVDGLIAGSAGRRKEGGRGEGREEDDDEDEAQDMFYYAKRGMVQEVMARLDEGGKEGGEEVSIDVRDEEGRTLLHWAVDGNHQALVELLLARRADVTTKDGEGETPLDYARLCEYEALVEVLVKWEATAAARRESGVWEGDEGKKGVEKG